MEKSVIFSLLILGVSSLIGQVIVLREMMVSFYGNEFFLGLVLAVWLAGTALGSLWLAQYLRKFIQGLNLLLICHILVALFLPILIGLIRLSRSWTEAAGQIPELLPALAWAILLPAPLCLILGCQFVAASQVFFRFARSQDQSVSRAYFLESLGFIMAGLIFSFWLILFNVWLSIFILVFLNGLAVYFLAFRSRTPNRSPSPKSIQLHRYFKIISLILIFLAAFLSWPQFSQFLNQVSLQWQFPHQKLVKTINSYYGQLALTQINQQYNFYESGFWLASSQPSAFNESLAHFSLLEHPQPKNVLLIGHGFTGLINEILKHQPEKITYLELDAEIIKLAKPYLPADWQQALKTPQVKIIQTDGRYFIKSTQEKFDLILINLTDPSTALLNRFYTQEFFQEIKKILHSKGILATYLSFSPNYQNQSLVRLNASIYQTLKKVFPNLLLLPEESTLLFLASEDVLIGQPELLIQRWQQRDLETKFISPAYLEYILKGERAKLAVQTLESEEIRINQDTWPISYLYNLFFWTSYFHPSWAKYLSLFLKINFWWILGLFLLGLLICRFLRKKISQQNSLWLAMAIGGFSLMASEILLIFAFQSFYGYLYYRLALLITAFMAGLAGGTWLGLRKIRPSQILQSKTWAGRQKNIQLFSVVKLHLFIIVYLICLGLLFLVWPNLLAKVSWFFSRDILFPFLAIIIGWLVGLEFVYVNHLYSKSKLSYCSSDPLTGKLSSEGGVENLDFSTPSSTFRISESAGLRSKNKLEIFHPGFIYSADLFGACLGALLTSLLLIPLFGLFQTLLILVLINFLIVVIFPQKSGQ